MPKIDFAVLVIGIVEEIVGISHRHGDYIIESDIEIPRREEGCFFKILNLDINSDLLQLSLHFRSNGSYRGALINGKLYSKRLPSFSTIPSPLVSLYPASVRICFALATSNIRGFRFFAP